MSAASGAVAPPTARRAIRWWHIALLACVLMIVGGWSYNALRTRAEVRVANPTFADIASTVSTTGTVVPVHDFPARANFTGMVDKIYVHLGQRVHAGQMLIRMKDQYAAQRLEAAKAALDDAEVNRDNVLHNGSQEDRIAFQTELQKAQAEQQLANHAFEAVKQMQVRGSASRAEVEAARQRLDTANASLRALNERMKSRYSTKDLQGWNERVKANKAQVDAERVSWANANISSPISGTVYILPAQLFDFVPAGADLLHVADLSRMQIRADFDEPDVGRLQIGQPVAITWDGAPGKVWHGRIQSKPLAVARAGARTIGQVNIAISDDKGDLPVNTNVAVVVTADLHSHVLAIPREALHTDGSTRYVYRVDGEVLARVPVEPGLANAMNVEIVRGLKPDDVIALHANNDEVLKDGLRVATVR